MNAPPHVKAPLSRHGFTLAETMVALLSASVLALTAGAMLVYAFKGLARNTTSVEQRRDVSYSAAVMTYRLRAASATEVSVNGGDLVIRNGAISQRISRSGGDLIFDPNTNEGGDEEVLLSGSVLTFAPAHLGGRVEIQLVVEENGNRADYAIAAAFRN